MLPTPPVRACVDNKPRWIVVRDLVYPKAEVRNTLKSLNTTADLKRCPLHEQSYDHTLPLPEVKWEEPAVRLEWQLPVQNVTPRAKNLAASCGGLKLPVWRVPPPPGIETGCTLARRTQRNPADLPTTVHLTLEQTNIRTRWGVIKFDGPSSYRDEPPAYETQPDYVGQLVSILTKTEEFQAARGIAQLRLQQKHTRQHYRSQIDRLRRDAPWCGQNPCSAS